MNWKTISLDSAVEQHGQPPGYHYDVARGAGPLVFLTGIGGLSGTRVVSGYDDLPAEVAAELKTGHIGQDWREEGIVAQAWFAWDLIVKLLAEQGAGLEDILYITTYITDANLMTGLTKVRTRFFPDRYPPGALVECGLLHPHMLIEISVVACRPSTS